jgi:hypothetical protein
MTSSCRSCHHAARTRRRWSPGPSNEAYLSSPHLEASPATTFHACSSPTPTPVKPQPAPAILSQESVHTALSITHHTSKRPSTSPQTTHGSHGGAVRQGQCQLHDTMLPTLVPPPRCTPRKGNSAVTSDQRSTSPPSLPALCGHPRHCVATPCTAVSSPALWKPGATGHRHVRLCAASGLPSAQPSNRHTDDDQTRSSHTTTLEATPGQAQDPPRCPPAVRFPRTITNSATLCAMSLYVALKPCDMTVNYLLLAYKRRRRSRGRGGGGQIVAHLHISSFIHNIGTSPQQTSGT